MPGHTMDQERKEKLRQMLLDQRETVQKEVDALLHRRSQEQAEQMQESVPDAADFALLEARGDEYLGIAASRDSVRQQYDEAIRRLEQGTYGLCEACGGEIPEARLKAVPFARRCKDCQDQAETIDNLEKNPDRRAI